MSFLLSYVHVFMLLRRFKVKNKSYSICLFHISYCRRGNSIDIAKKNGGGLDHVYLSLPGTSEGSQLAYDARRVSQYNRQQLDMSCE